MYTCAAKKNLLRFASKLGRFLVVTSIFLPCSLLLSETSSLSLEFPQHLIEKYSQSFPIALGSGLAYAGREGDADIFYAVTDSGPSVDESCPKELQDAAKKFKPLYGKIRVTEDGAEVVWLREIQSKKAIDPEGIALAQNGDLWIVEEFAPSLLLADKDTGEVRKRYKPGKGLPKALKHRREGRGLEGVAVAPDGKVVAVMQSALEKKDKGRIRLVVFDPKSESSTQFYHDISGSEYHDVSDVRIGAVEALTNEQVIFIERVLREGAWSANLVTANLVETLEGKKERRAVQVSSREKLQLDGSLKFEGLGVRGNKSLVIIHDNDFGLSLCDVSPLETNLYIQ